MKAGWGRRQSAERSNGPGIAASGHHKSFASCLIFACQARFRRLDVSIRNCIRTLLLSGRRVIVILLLRVFCIRPRRVANGTDLYRPSCWAGWRPRPAWARPAAPTCRRRPLQRTPMPAAAKRRGARVMVQREAERALLLLPPRHRRRRQREPRRRSSIPISSGPSSARWPRSRGRAEAGGIG